MSVQGKVRKVCPVCGGRIKVCRRFQYSMEHQVLRSGKLSSGYTKTDARAIGGRYAFCERCGEFWEERDFTFDKDGFFLDLKHDD